MRIVKSNKFKKCRDGTIMNEFLLDEKITPQFLEYLGRFGEVTILSTLDPPFYSCRLEEYLTMKGMLDDTAVHIKFNRDSLEAGREYLHTLLDGYPGNMPTIE